MTFRPWLAMAMCLCATAASARIDLPAALSETPQTFSTTYGNGWLAGQPLAPFLETVAFTWSSTGSSVSGTFSGVGGGLTLNDVYMEANVAFFSEDSAVFSPLVNTIHATVAKTDVGYSFTFDQVPFAPGHYLMGFSGKFGNQGVNGLKGTLGLAPAVPEASTAAMLALGLGGLLVARRRAASAQA